MESRVEVDRLRKVYRQYTASGYGSSKWSSSNKGNEAIQRERQRKIYGLLQKAGFIPFRNTRVLDVGCGSGELLGTLADWGANPENLFGVDLIPERVRTARRKFRQIRFQIANAEAMPFGERCFDLVTVFTVFTSILDRQMALNISSEINRVLAPGGGVLWYDFRMNNPCNRHVRGVSRKDIQGLFPGFSVALETLSLLPPLARRLGRFTDLLYRPLSLLPCLRSHYLGLLIKP